MAPWHKDKSLYPSLRTGFESIFSFIVRTDIFKGGGGGGECMAQAISNHFKHEISMNSRMSSNMKFHNHIS